MTLNWKVKTDLKGDKRLKHRNIRRKSYLSCVKAKNSEVQSEILGILSKTFRLLLRSEYSIFTITHKIMFACLLPRWFIEAENETKTKM